MAAEKNQKLPVFNTLEKEEENDHDKKVSSSSAMTKKGAYAAISYMVSAVLLVMFNKAALSSYKFPCVNVITLFQMASSLALLYAMKLWKIISFIAEPQNNTDNPGTLVPLKTLVHTLPLAISYLFYMTNYGGVHNDYRVLVNWDKHSYTVVGSVGIILAGAFVVGARDLSFDAYGYSVVFVANICTSIYFASIARIGKSSGLNTFGLMRSNGIICLPILFLWTFINGDLSLMISFPRLFSFGFQAVMLLFPVFMAFMINYCVF